MTTETIAGGTMTEAGRGTGRRMDEPCGLPSRNWSCLWLAAGDGGDKGRPDSLAAARSGSRERLLGKRVLIVEDEALLALDLQFAFEDEGAEVLGPALSLERAQQIVETQEIDLALLDVDIAGREVYPVAGMLLKRGIPFIFHTGHGSREELAELFPGTITCTKPTLPADLIAKLLQAAERNP